MIGPIEQLHIDNKYFFKLQRLPSKSTKLGCVFTMPACNVLSKIDSKNRTYFYKDGILTIKDSYKNKTSKIAVPKSAVRPTILLDVLLQVDVYNASPSLIILYDENDNIVISQDIYEFLNMTLTIDEANEEKCLFEEISMIMNHEFKNSDSIGYKILQNCVINGGLV